MKAADDRHACSCADAEQRYKPAPVGKMTSEMRHCAFLQALSICCSNRRQTDISYADFACRAAFPSSGSSAGAPSSEISATKSQANERTKHFIRKIGRPESYVAKVVAFSRKPARSLVKAGGQYHHMQQSFVHAVWIAGERSSRISAYNVFQQS